MGRNIGPKNKIARRFGVDLGLKTNPAKVARRLNQKPGVHGLSKGKPTNSAFGRQLIEKQKAKYIYGMREGQFRRFVIEATRVKGDSGINLQRLLETRLDNVVYRLGFAETRAQARQLVTHGFFMLNNQPHNVPSYLVKVGDVINLKENKTKKKLFVNLDEVLAKKEMPSWLTMDVTKKIGKVLSMPDKQDFENIFDVKLIIEYYSSR